MKVGNERKKCLCSNPSQRLITVLKHSGKELDDFLRHLVDNASQVRIEISNTHANMTEEHLFRLGTLSAVLKEVELRRSARFK